MSLRKLAETIELSIDIPESEKKMAAKIVMRFEKMIKKLDYFSDHLELMYDPFSKYNSVSEESILKYRRIIWNYIGQVKDNFESIKDLATICMKELNYFKNDTEIDKLRNTFSDFFYDLDTQVLDLFEILSDWEADEYQKKVISIMEIVMKEVSDIREFIYDRVIEHINSNILMRNWVEYSADKLNIDLKEKEPAITRLYKDREKRIKNMM